MGHLVLSTSDHPMLASLVVFLTSICLLLVWRRKPGHGTKAIGKIAPELPSAWPILGHLPMLSAGRAGASADKLLHKKLGRLADEHGSVFTIRIGVYRAFVVSSWEIAKECYTTHDKVFPSRPKLISGDIIGQDHASFSFAPYGPYYIELRKILVSELLSNRRMELLKNVRYSEIDSSMNDLYHAWANHNNAAGPLVVELKKWFGDLTLNMILRMITGKRYSSATSASDAKELLRWRVAMRDFMRLLSVNMIEDAIPYLKWFDLQGYKKQMRNNIEELESLFKGWLQDHREKRATGNVNEEQDFIYVMMSALENTKMSYYYDHDTIITATCLSIISGGADTTMLTIAWIFSLLLNNKEALKKAQDELDNHVGRDRRVNESDIKNLIYLQAVIKESYRLYPSAPLSGIRVASQDCTLAGYHVPAGSRLIVNLSKIHRDPSVWSNPSEFSPERFLTKHVDMEVKGQHYQLMPFSSGRRMCPGMAFALHVVPLVAAHLLQGFNLKTPMDMPVDMTETGGTTNVKATPLEVVISPRLRPELY